VVSDARCRGATGPAHQAGSAGESVDLAVLTLSRLLATSWGSLAATGDALP